MLWVAATTTPADRQIIVRHPVERVVISIQGPTEVVDIAIHWVGGFASRHQILCPVGRYDLLRDYKQLISRIVELKRASHTAREIAERLNAEGFSPPRRDHRFNANTLRLLMMLTGLSDPSVDSLANADLFGPDEWWASDLAGELGISRPVLCKWCCRG